MTLLDLNCRGFYREGMTDDKRPSRPAAPPRPDKIVRRENALRDNLLKRKQQQRARQHSEPVSQPPKESE